MLDYFETFRENMINVWAAKGQDDNPGADPVYKPPKPTYRDAVRTLLNVVHNKLSSEDFATSLKRCFEKVGLAPSAYTAIVTTSNIITPTTDKKYTR